MPHFHPGGFVQSRVEPMRNRLIMHDLILRDTVGKGGTSEGKGQGCRARCPNFASGVSSSLWSFKNLIPPLLLPMGEWHASLNNMLNNHSKYFLQRAFAFFLVNPCRTMLGCVRVCVCVCFHACMVKKNSCSLQ